MQRVFKLVWHPLTLHLLLSVCELWGSATQPAAVWTSVNKWRNKVKKCFSISVCLRGDSASPSLLLPFHCCQLQQFWRQQFSLVDSLFQLWTRRLDGRTRWAEKTSRTHQNYVTSGQPEDKMEGFYASFLGAVQTSERSSKTSYFQTSRRCPQGSQKECFVKHLFCTLCRH